MIIMISCDEVLMIMLMKGCQMGLLLIRVLNFKEWVGSLHLGNGIMNKRLSEMSTFEQKGKLSV